MTGASEMLVKFSFKNSPSVAYHKLPNSLALQYSHYTLTLSPLHSSRAIGSLKGNLTLIVVVLLVAAVTSTPIAATLSKGLKPPLAPPHHHMEPTPVPAEELGICQETPKLGQKSKHKNTPSHLYVKFYLHQKPGKYLNHRFFLFTYFNIPLSSAIYDSEYPSTYYRQLCDQKPSHTFWYSFH